MVLFNSLETSLNSTSPSSSIDSKFSPWLLSLAYPLGCRLLMPSYFGHIDVQGRQHLPAEGPVILAPTHRSRWDALLVPYATGRWVTGRDLRFMVTADEMKGIQGWFIRRLGGFSVNPRQPAIATLRFGVELLQDREMLVIFPEGGIFRDRNLHPLKPGLARLALQAEMSEPGLGVKIVPISLMYSDPYASWGARVTIRIGAPLDVAQYSEGPAKQNAKYLTADLEAALRNLDQISISESMHLHDHPEPAASHATSQ